MLIVLTPRSISPQDSYPSTAPTNYDAHRSKPGFKDSYSPSSSLYLDISCSIPREGPTRDPALPEALAPAKRAYVAGISASPSAAGGILAGSRGSVTSAERDFWPPRRSTKKAWSKRLHNWTYEMIGTPSARASVTYLRISSAHPSVTDRIEPTFQFVRI